MEGNWIYGGFKNHMEMDGHSNGFNINQIRKEMRQMRAEIMQQIRTECNCKKMDYTNYNYDSNDYYDD